MYCEGTADILDDNECRAATHVFIYTHTPSTAASLRPRDDNRPRLQCIAGHVVHGPDRVTVHPPPPGQSETKFLLFIGPPRISKVDAIKKKLGWTTCFGPFSKWPPSKSGNHLLCHNLSSKAVRVTKLVSMYMFLGVRNPILPIKNVSVLWKIYKQLFQRIFRAFLVIFCVSPWDREGYCAPSHL